MRLVTWNCCRGSVAKKLPLLENMAPSIVTLQECRQPATEDASTIWHGDPGRQGVAVYAADGYRISPIPQREAPRYAVPIQVDGPVRFFMLAVWSKTDLHYRYVKAVIRALECYRDLILAQPTVLIGDFNSNRIWDYKRPPAQNHSGLVRNLDDLGLVSAYHEFHGEAQGLETRATLYLLKKKARPYHIDYCFIPRIWLPYLRSVEVGTYEAWSPSSDHAPLLVDLDMPATAYGIKHAHMTPCQSTSTY